MRLSGVAGQGAVRVVVVDELLELGEEVQRFHGTISSVSTTAQPSFK